jgi:tetratricopeptide (TPR) repeat protein
MNIQSSHKTNDKKPIKRIRFFRLVILFFISLFAIESGLQCGYRLGRYVLDQKQKATRIKKSGTTCTILALGESTTATGGMMAWPAQLERILNDDTDIKNKGIQCQVINEGLVGTNTTVILGHLQKYLNTYKPNIVISMMGINDYALQGGYEDPYGVHFSVSSRNSWQNILNKIQLYRVYQFFYQDINDFITFHMRRNVTKLINMGNEYRLKGDYNRSEKTLQRAIVLDPKNDWALDNYGWLLRDEFRYEEAEEEYLMAIAVNHNSDSPYVEAANFYRQIGNFEESKRMYDRALQVNENSAWAYDELGNWYQDQKQYQLSEDQYRNAIEKDHSFENAWFDLGTLLRDEGRLDEAENIYNTLLSFTKNPYRVTEEKATLLRIQKGNAESILDEQVVNEVTKHNYQVLQEKLSAIHVPLIAVQYPTKPILLLLNLFATTDDTHMTPEKLQQKEVYVVDNEMIFKDALQTDPYDSLFIDHFGGTFGHATSKGNELLAKNIAVQVKSILLKKQ